MQILERHEGVVHALLFSPDGETIVSAGKDGSVRCWDAWGDSAELFKAPGFTQSLAVSSDSRYLALGGKAGSLDLWNLSERVRVQRFADDEGVVSGVAFLPDDNTVAYSLGTFAVDTEPAAGSVRFWNWRENRVRPLPADIAPTTAVRVMTMLGPHQLLAWVTQNNILTVWPIVRSTPTRISLKFACRALAFSPDGKTLAASADWKVLLYDVERKQERAVLAGHKGAVSSLAFSPDGRHLMTGSWDKSVKIWDAATSRESASYEWPVGRVGAVAYAADGLRAAAAGDEGRIAVWDVDG